ILRAELDVVLIRLPREIVDQLIVAVHASARISAGCAELREPTDQDNWKAVISESASHIQPNRTGMKASVLRKKIFRKPVPAEAQFIDFGSRESPHMRQRNELNARGCESIKPGKLAAACCKS